MSLKLKAVRATH